MDVKHYRLEVRPSAIDRTGCFAGEAIPEGVVFREYTGELISQAEALRREADASRPAVYTLWLESGEVLDGWLGGNETIYLNHSCAPNCFLEEAEGRVYVGAERDIAAGEELTIDYAYDVNSPLEPCRCGAAECRGYLNEVVNGSNGLPAPDPGEARVNEWDRMDGESG